MPKKAKEDTNPTDRDVDVIDGDLDDEMEDVEEVDEEGGESQRHGAQHPSTTGGRGASQSGRTEGTSKKKK
jgi:hypothetical protein